MSRGTINKRLGEVNKNQSDVDSVTVWSNEAFTIQDTNIHRVKIYLKSRMTLSINRTFPSLTAREMSTLPPGLRTGSSVSHRAKLT